MNGSEKIDGYAVQNTRHVLLALEAYERVVGSEGSIDAEDAAIACYESMAQHRVSGRTIRKWRTIVATYGGIEKTPENAFGARKSCPHLDRPILRRLRQLQKECESLSNWIRKHGDSNFVNEVELAAIDHISTDCMGAVLNNKPLAHLASIHTVARRLENLPIHRLCKYVSAAETEAIVEHLLKRVKVLAATQLRKEPPRP